ncbi:hypothetical protein TRFO_18121 [Tritrichomonas foetus]|uniref:MULE transposase domain-containing protein n=1 Tax=Tritrichomonas foetus TaxID=1144522 RepID=A0A1J4KMT5_9EUKA|nr:hypothetical protein TRFO_18121 [Tritrichomonas foetus]|eukprot:OHT12208.1 hypothetical protein TRFO_18121 [Tritrichomonas foetus]
MGSGLIKFARLWKINQFFCHFHIRRSFGVNELTPLLEVMLNIVSETEFLKEKEKILESIEELRTNSNDSKCEILIKLINKTKTWGLWHRSVYGMATCSNFAEGFHQILNSITADNHQFFVKLHQVIIKIENKFFNATTYPHYNTKADLVRFRQEADKALATKDLMLVANVNVDRKIIKRYTKS